LHFDLSNRAKTCLQLTAAIDKALESAFLKYAEAYIPEEKLEKFNSLRSISDIRFPSEWFPDARQMKRYSEGEEERNQ